MKLLEIFVACTALETDKEFHIIKLTLKENVDGDQREPIDLRHVEVECVRFVSRECLVCWLLEDADAFHLLDNQVQHG